MVIRSFCAIVTQTKFMGASLEFLGSEKQEITSQRKMSDYLEFLWNRESEKRE